MNNSKEKILEATVNYIANNEDLNTFTMSMIANQVSLGKSTVYDYFSSKEDLIAEAIKYILNRYYEVYQNVSFNTFEEGFKNLLRETLNIMSYAKSVLTSVFLNELKLSYNQEINQKAQEIKKLVFEKAEQAYILGIKEGTINNTNTKHLFIIKGLVFGSIFRYAKCDQQVSKEQLIDEIIYGFLKLINE